MNAKTLQNRYPGSQLQKESGDKQKYFHFFDGFNYLLIPKEDLNENEAWILSQLSVKKLPQSAWYAFLMQGQSCPKKGNKIYQCFHFHSNHLRYPDEWLINLSAFFENIEDAFFITEESGVIISSQIITEKEQLEAGLALLDDDFSSKTKAYLGIPCQVQTMPKVFQEEQKILRELENVQGIQSISQVYLQRYFMPQLAQNVLFEEMRRHLQHEEDAIEIIQTLWKNQGNLSASSKELHLHRNTLLYRLNKMEEQSGLDLRDLHQLFLAYLLSF